MNQQTSTAEYRPAGPVSFQEAANKIASATQSLSLVDTLRTMARIHFDGNIKPHAWFKHIRFSNGKPDPIAMDLLSEIVYWYRPETKKREQTGETVAYRKKFKADKLQRSIGSFSEQFGYTKRQVSEALSRLEKLGLIDREYRTIHTPMGKMPNVLYIGINAIAIQSISHDDLVMEEDTANDDESSDYLVFETTHDEETQSPKNAPSFHPQSSMPENQDFTQGSACDGHTSTFDGHTSMCDGTTSNAVGTSFTVRPSHNERDTSHIECSTYTETTTEIAAAASNETKKQNNAAFIAAAAKINKHHFSKKSFTPFTPMAEEDSLIGKTLTAAQRDLLQQRVAQLKLSDAAAAQLFKQLEAGLLDCEHCFTKSGRDFHYKLNAMLKSVREGAWTPPASLARQVSHEKEHQTQQQQRERHALQLALSNAINEVNALKRNLASVDKTATYYPSLVAQYDKAVSHVKTVQAQLFVHCPDVHFNQIKYTEENIHA